MLQRLEAIKDASQIKKSPLDYYGYSHLSSRSEKEFWRKFKVVAPFEIRAVKTIMGVKVFRVICEGV